VVHAPVCGDRVTDQEDPDEDPDDPGEHGQAAAVAAPEQGEDRGGSEPIAYPAG
jgi:hypothetical protein